MKQKDQLLSLFNSQEVLDIYQKVEDFREKYRNDVAIRDPVLEQMKSDYKQKFKAELKKVEEMIDKQIEDVFTQHSQKSLYLLDQLFQKHYPIEHLVREHQQLTNTNRA